MNKIKILALTTFFLSSHSVMGGIYSGKLTVVGQENNGTSIYVKVEQNSDGCLNGGIYFNDSKELKGVLAIALLSKTTNIPVRIDFNQFANKQCVGQHIYLN